MAELPSHLAIGRGAFAGPVAGGYSAFTGVLNEAAAFGTGAHIRFGWVAPYDLRVERVDFRSRTGAVVVTARTYKNTAAGGFSITGGTPLHTGFSVAAAGTTNVSQNAGATAAFASSAARNVLKGETLFVEYTYDAAGFITDHTCVITYFAQGHVNANPVDD